MPRLKVTVKVNGNALRRAYVEHLVGPAPIGVYMTDNSGRIRDQNGDQGIDSLTSRADIRVLCQNSVVRVLDGNRMNVLVWQDKNVGDGSSVNLNTNAEQDDHYAILNRCLLVYDVVFRQFQVFGDLPHPDFPLGRQTSLKDTKDQQKRLELTFPSQFPLGNLAFTEPASLSTGFPLIHIRKRSSDGRLFGEDGKLPTLVPSEFSHALHFSRFSQSGRNGIETDYVGWITSDLAGGGGGTHKMTKRTSPKVAYIEALDHFSLRFSEFIRQKVQGGTSTLVTPQEMTADIRRDFIASELSGSPPAGISVATLDAGRIKPNPDLHGGDDEGSVYGCIFVDFGRRAGLRTAVNAYFRSAADGVTTFGGYKNWISSHHPEHANSLAEAQQTWGL